MFHDPFTLESRIAPTLEKVASLQGTVLGSGPKNLIAHPFAYYLCYMTVCAKKKHEKDCSLRGV